MRSAAIQISHGLGYALVLLVEVNGGLSREKGGGDNVREGPEATGCFDLNCVRA